MEERVNYPVLHYGQRGPWVMELKKALESQNYYHGNIDDNFDSGLLAVVKQYQGDHTLGDDGVVGYYTWNTIFAGDDVKKPSNVYTVKRGDSLYSIARSHGTTVENIKKTNYLMSNFLKVGQQLLIR